MKYSPIDILRKYVIKQCIEHLVVTSNVPVWLNLTFWENVTNKSFASKCWDKLSKTILREYPEFRLVGVWARQGRGAWHIHAVCNMRLPVDWFRSKAMRCGFGPQCFLCEVDSRVESPRKIAAYIGGYATDKNGLDPEKDKGVRRMIFVGKHVKVINMRYKSELKRITGIGRELTKEIDSQEWIDNDPSTRHLLSQTGRKRSWESWGDWYKRNRDYWFDVGRHTISNEVFLELVEADEYLKKYLNEGRWSYV